MFDACYHSYRDCSTFRITPEQAIHFHERYFLVTKEHGSETAVNVYVGMQSGSITALDLTLNVDDTVIDKCVARRPV